ncbi:lycopene cyclase domain-containing protein [Carboxylicivirga sediminis]|uniref:Lycopene cyclase domain-containing protein n=1 Tax=Carboxylicivirga sediminis TaxID=2006564 RepID=A0A941F2G4_9BACT|nr:lycopene cyclase domain-containing protein [Carboxylicivirga sediminis]MBR8535526.1 lycopene cyclase domain-containing protein [Carboxylicivirga sediminis]
MEKYTYLIINIACIFIPLVASFYRRHAFVKEWRYFIPANLLVAFVFLVWDYYFTRMGVWGFNPDYLTGVYLLNLPLEEVLFFIAIPYACVFNYFAMRYLVNTNPLRSFQSAITLTLAMVFLLTAIGFYGRWYTSLTAALAGMYLLIAFYKRRDLSYVYLSYFIILPFFFLSNGILTGSFIDEPIVWYNNAENLGLRMGTIPVEDSVYGFLLVLMNIDLYEWLKQRARHRKLINISS